MHKEKDILLWVFLFGGSSKMMKFSVSRIAKIFVLDSTDIFWICT